MQSPGRTAAISAVALVLIGYSILSSSESPSSGLAILQYALLIMALIGLIGSLARIGRN
jgi:hypothetical protein